VIARSRLESSYDVNKEEYLLGRTVAWIRHLSSLQPKVEQRARAKALNGVHHAPEYLSYVSDNTLSLIFPVLGPISPPYASAVSQMFHQDRPCHLPWCQTDIVFASEVCKEWRSDRESSRSRYHGNPGSFVDEELL
jgi:hypothetical protein